MRSTSRHNRPTAIVLTVLVLVLGLVGFKIWADSYFFPKTSLEANWSITVPRGLTVVEKHSEGSFHGDGYRLTVFKPSKGAPLEGSFFDLDQMSSADLTPDELELVAAANSLFQPENYLNTQQSGLKKRVAIPSDEKARYSNTLLCVFDGEANRFYAYEWLI